MYGRRPDSRSVSSSASSARRPRTAGKVRVKETKIVARAPSPELVDGGEENDQGQMLSDLARIVADLHESDGVGLKDIAKKLSVPLEVPDATKKVNVLILGSGGVAMDFVEWYTGEKLQVRVFL